MQYQAQSAADFATNPVRFDATGWTRQGGNDVNDVYVNDKTGEVVYVGKDGRIQGGATSWQQGNAAELTPGQALGELAGSSPPSADQIGAQDIARQNLQAFADQLMDQRANYGTTGNSPGVAPQIGEFGVTSAPAAAAMNAPAPGTTVAPAPTPVPTATHITASPVAGTAGTANTVGAPTMAPPPPSTVSDPSWNGVPVAAGGGGGGGGAAAPVSNMAASLQRSVALPGKLMSSQPAADAMMAPAGGGGGGGGNPLGIPTGTGGTSVAAAGSTLGPAAFMQQQAAAAAPAPTTGAGTSIPGTQLPSTNPGQVQHPAGPVNSMTTPSGNPLGIPTGTGGTSVAAAGAALPPAPTTAKPPAMAPPPPAPATSGPSIYGGPAASMQAAQSAGATAIRPGLLGANAQTVAAPTIAAPGSVTAPTIAAPLTANAQTIAAPTPITTQGVGAQQIGPVGLIGANSNVGSQQAAMAMLAGAAQGNVPSAAEALMRKAMDENEGSALGMAATMQGSRPGMALRQGLQAQRAAGAKSAADLAALRATEQATARGQLVESTQGARAQDIQASTANLTAQIDTLKANQATALAAGNTNAANALQAQIATLQGQLDASKANQSTALTAVLANQSTGADLAKSQASMQLQSQITSLQSQIEVAKANAANALAAGQSNQAASLQAQIATMNTQLDAMKANQASQLSTATTNAGLTQQANLTNAQLQQNQQQFGATQQLSAAEKNQQAQLFEQQLNNGQYLGLTQLQQQALMAPYQAMLQQQQLKQQQDAANQAFYAQLAVAGGTALAASDVTLKTDIAPGAEAALAFLDALPDPVTFRYKDGKAHYPGKQLGFIAQKLPSSVVTTGPDGKKWISANVIGQVLAGLGNVHKRLGQVEETTQLTRREGGDSVPSSDLVEFARKLAA